MYVTCFMDTFHIMQILTCLNYKKSNCIVSYYRQNLLCDVTLVADGVEIPAHKMVLASCSPYFYAMFTSFTESKAEKITIQGVDGQALQILVDYVYSSEIQVTEDNVQVLFQAQNTKNNMVFEILSTIRFMVLILQKLSF